MEKNVSRRGFIKGAGLGAVVAGTLGAAGSAMANEAASYTFADTVAWDAEYDVVVAGCGFAGMAAATTAADEGASVLLTEKLAAGPAGGNSRVCAQLFIWGNDDVEATKAYYEDLNGSRIVPDDALTAYVEGIAALGTTLTETFGMPAEDFKDVADMGYGCMSPEFPEFAGQDKVHLYATHEGAFDSYLYQAMRKRVEDNYADKIDVWFESPAAHLIQDPVSKAIIGVQIERSGAIRNVRALNGVVIATGGFEGDVDMVQQYMSLVNYKACGSTDNTGDGIKMCMEVGAKLWHMENWCGLGGFGATSFITPEGVPASRIHDFDQGAMNTGASILVGKDGRRWVNESEVPRHGKVCNGNGQWLNPNFPDDIFAVFDEKQMTEIDAAGDVPAEYADQVVECATIDDAAIQIGCPAENLQTTIADYGTFVEAGKDYQFGRDIATMRTFEGDKVFILPLKPALLNTQGGPQRGAAGEVIGLDEQPIPHLYSAGECGGLNGFQYAGGGNVAECFIFGQISGRSAAAAKDPLPAYVEAKPVESNPAHLGDESDLFAGAVTADTEGALIGTAKGIGGDVTVEVALDDKGVIASVVVISHAETEGIGTKAIDALPAEFAGLATAEEIDAVDGISGATVTSNALKDAVKAAMGF